MSTVKSMNTNDDWFSWMLGGIVTVIAALATAVTTLWSRSEARNAEAIKALTVHLETLEKRNDECEKDRMELFGRVGRLESKLESLQGTENKSKDIMNRLDAIEAKDQR